MSGVCGYEDWCGSRESLCCEYSSCDGCPIKDLARPMVDALRAENDSLRGLVRGMHMAYVGTVNRCEGLDESLTWEFSGDVDGDLAKQHAGYEQDRHRFDAAMRELGLEVSA